MSAPGATAHLVQQCGVPLGDLFSNRRKVASTIVRR